MLAQAKSAAAIVFIIIIFPSSALLWRALNCPVAPCDLLIINDKRKIISSRKSIIKN
ncbi:hypothetical protein CES85_2922 (plasmid) [Ochrobactrum quorumnocens]|uniref:Uncharacterized protein n=1 Tax=Ochrobactrum quorumnocens TaxID=271865 RepID=A0A248UQV4_9HYPH|nr:hypothetical protein CES85_2922 [[Ochrobactrum] quorumnocens]